jgi:hypothetical protein
MGAVRVTDATRLGAQASVTGGHATVYLHYRCPRRYEAVRYA